MPVTLEDMGQALWQRQQKEITLEGERDSIYPHGETASSSIDSTPPGRASQEGVNHSSQWAEFRLLIITDKQLNFCTDRPF